MLEIGGPDGLRGESVSKMRTWLVRNVESGSVSVTDAHAAGIAAELRHAKWVDKTRKARDDVSLKHRGYCVTNMTKDLNTGAIRYGWSEGIATAFVAVVGLVSGFATNAAAQSIAERLRGCLTIEDMTRARLDCYDAVVPPVIEDCRLIKQEDQRLICFNRFLELPLKPTTPEVVSSTSKSVNLSKPAPSSAQPSVKNKGCSLPGLHRLPDGKCTSRKK